MAMPMKSHAASLSSASATLSTSRPSPSTPLNGTSLSGEAQVTVFNSLTTRSSRFLASDSARLVHEFLNQTGSVTITEGLNVASQSSDLLTVYFTNNISARAGAGADVLYVPITAMHTVGFTPNSQVPSGGKIVITFPGTTNTSASPSATTFALNGLTSANAATYIQSFPATACAGGITVSTTGAPTITCTTSAIQPNNTYVRIFIGCTAAASAGCTTQSPRIINPTKSQTTGTADIWKVGIATQDASSQPLDNSTVAIGSIESVTVRATIDPSLTFSIAGIGDGQLLSGVNSGCAQLDTTNTGIGSSATEVGLGVLSLSPGANNTVNNIAAQNLTVTTNGQNGYSITATSSGPLKNASTGYFLNSVIAPIAFPAAGHFFGLHACGIDTDLAKWNSSPGNTACNTRVSGSTGNLCQYGWPTATIPLLIAQDNSGPIGTTVTAGNGLTLVSYAATQDVLLPPGEYQAIVTYVATPSF